MILEAKMPSNSLWISRDMVGSGLYALWVDGEPEISDTGYYKPADGGRLLMTIHSSVFPFSALRLSQGDCIRVALEPALIDNNITGGI